MMHRFALLLLLALATSPATLLAQQDPTQPPPMPSQQPPSPMPKQPGQVAPGGGPPGSMPANDTLLLPPPSGNGSVPGGAPGVMPTSGTTTYTITIPPGSGNGTCSPDNVTSLSYTLIPPLPASLAAVLACNRPAYDALLPANLSDPATASLPPPLLDLSCFPEQGQPGVRNCTRAFPANRRLRPQQMCVLMKNSGNEPVTVRVSVAWGDAASSANSTNSTNSTNAAVGKQTAAGRMVALTAVVGALWWMA